MHVSKKDEIYVEEDHAVPGLRLEDGEYARAINSFIVVTADAVIVDEEAKLFYLAKRAVKPMQGWWVIGGRRLPGETAKESVARSFARETSLQVALQRFHFAMTQERIWKNRKETPQEVGKHDLAFIFKLALSPEERAHVAAHLDPGEYDASLGLRAFDRAALVGEDVHPALLELYDLLFKSG